MGRRKRNLLKEISLKKMSRFTIIPIETIMSHDYLRIMAEPFKSSKQRKWMFKNKPKLAKKFARHKKGKKRR